MHGKICTNFYYLSLFYKKLLKYFWPFIFLFRLLWYFYFGQYFIQYRILDLSVLIRSPRTVLIRIFFVLSDNYTQVTTIRTKRDLFRDPYSPFDVRTNALDSGDMELHVNNLFSGVSSSMGQYNIRSILPPTVLRFCDTFSQIFFQNFFSIAS